jgi:hypothetical protein
MMQVQRWKLRRRMPWLGRVEAVLFFVLTPLALLLLVVAIAGWGSGGSRWPMFGVAALAAAESGFMWRYVAGAPTGDEPPPLPADRVAAAHGAYRWLWVYVGVFVSVGIIGVVLGVANSPLNLIWGLPFLAIGLAVALAMLVVVRPRLSRLTGQRGTTYKAEEAP